ncbi:poly(ADP-ribose) glycohydrolase 1-like [Chenopodium quinoa]|uniref:poly(ADP-ribose) glycohydrolase 1-like n=1 Tax=Chenopodium quinoa TaxID=63459 RepID=UPI000B78922B|nr:poly(ADP-ribose) glycohydrolase 1-like [Chenopodium quinoa]
MVVKRTDFKSILPFLPPLTPQQSASSSSSLAWPNHQVTDALQQLAQGPTQSRVNSGERLFAAISRIRGSLPLSSKDRLAKSTAVGFAKFFSEMVSEEQSRRWFEDVVPKMGDLVLRLPALLEAHYRECDSVVSGVSTGLRLLEPQQPGIVFLSQLIAALLSCSFFCLFPTLNRKAKRMKAINMDQIFSSLHDSYHAKQENKLKCITHYFERICSSRPSNYVSYERKVLSPEQNPSVVPLPSTDFWANSAAPLCEFKIFPTGKIEHHPPGSLEVDFADEYIGGLVLTKGCVQEEIRFMMNPELIVAMLFMPSMSENEAIEMDGAERFSNYRGYNASFQYTGDYIDRRGVDALRRRVSRVIAIDALRRAGTKQYQSEFLLREVNKAFCGFLDHSEYLQHQQTVPGCNGGIVTGNWGCGIFGGDPQIKSMIQWVSASQASRPFVSYYTFGLDKVKNLDQVVEWIVSQKWTVGDLWNKLVEYGVQRDSIKKIGFFSYLLPSLKEESASSKHRRGSDAEGDSRGRGRGRFKK